MKIISAELHLGISAELHLGIYHMINRLGSIYVTNIKSTTAVYK